MTTDGAILQAGRRVRNLSQKLTRENIELQMAHADPKAYAWFQSALPEVHSRAVRISRVLKSERREQRRTRRESARADAAEKTAEAAEAHGRRVGGFWALNGLNYWLTDATWFLFLIGLLVVVAVATTTAMYVRLNGVYTSTLVVSVVAVEVAVFVFGLVVDRNLKPVKRALTEAGFLFLDKPGREL
jgi:hypothetical protein